MRLAIVDFGSFVLPYDFYLVTALAERDCSVIFFASETRFNPEFLDALRSHCRVEVVSRPVSRSVSGRTRALTSYMGLLWSIWSRRRDYDFVNLQFCARWQAEIPLFWMLRKKLIFTVHNAVPHDFRGRRYWPYGLMAGFARELWFLSRATAEEFYQRYSDRFRRKANIVPMGTIGVSPESPVTPYRLPSRLEGIAYWSTVKPYKGIELMLALAQDRGATEGGSRLEVHGRWDAELQPIRQDLIRHGVQAEDKYLSTEELQQLLTRDLVFLLPYRTASQSAALYTLLHHGRLFLTTDVGDLGDFMRRFGLAELILSSPTVESVRRCMAWLTENLPYAVERFAEAQRAMSWDEGVAAALAKLGPAR